MLRNKWLHNDTATTVFKCLLRLHGTPGGEGRPIAVSLPMRDRILGQPTGLLVCTF